MAISVNCVGIVLAGGQSRRFGSPKPFAQFKGKSFSELAIKTISILSNTIFVVTNEVLIQEMKPMAANDCILIKDVERFSGMGPLAGMYSAMIRKKAEFYIVIPCDMPLMESSLYQKWLNFAQSHDYDCVVPVVNGKVYPLNGIYRNSCVREIFSCLSNNICKVMELLNRESTYYIEITGEDEKYFVNINTKDQLNFYH